MKVNGNSIPEKVVELGDKTYLNLGVKDVSYIDENENEIISGDMDDIRNYIEDKF